MKRVLKGILYGIIMGISICILFTAIKASSNYNYNDIKLEVAIFVLAFYLANYSQLILHEFGHFVMGLMTGYSFGSFRIGSFAIGLRNGKLLFYRASMPGTAGQCIMMPPSKDKNGEFPNALYLYGGVIMNLITSAICIYILMKMHFIPFISEFLASLVFMGITFALINGIPLILGGVPNDGKSISLLKKDKTSRDMFYNQLVIMGLLQEGKRYNDMPNELFIIPENADFKNYLVTSVLLLDYNRYQELGNDEKAKEILSFLLDQGNLLEIQRAIVKIEQLYYAFIDSKGNIDIKEYMDKETNNFMRATRFLPSTLRTNYAIKKLVEKDELGAEKTLKLFEKSINRFPYSAEIAIERRLVDDLKKIEPTLVSE